MKRILIFATLIILLFDLSLANNNPGSKRASLRGSKQSMLMQINVVNSSNLTHIRNDKQLELFIKKGLLVPIDRIENVNIDYRLLKKYSFAKPFTANFLKDFGAAYFKKYGLYIQVNSALRTIEGQIELRKCNTNAAPAMQSSHTTGATIDISYLDMSNAQKQWARSYLLRLEVEGLIEATEEFTQTVFHIMVFPEYEKHKK